MLLANQCLNCAGFFIDDIGFPISEDTPIPDFEIDDLVLRIPLSSYTRLSAILYRLFLGGNGRVVWTTAGGVLQGGIRTGYHEASEVSYDLQQWAKTQSQLPLAPTADITSPVWRAWARKVELAFITQNSGGI